MVGYLGGSSTPNEIEIYSDNISDKDKIINVLKESLEQNETLDVEPIVDESVEDKRVEVPLEDHQNEDSLKEDFVFQDRTFFGFYRIW